MIGLYIHFPFCEKKCPYCDFYSVAYDEKIAEDYVQELCRRLKLYTDTFNTVYFGGGTPSLLKPSQIERILDCVHTSKDCEITLEANPHSAFLNWEYNPGINRLSMGVQSANLNELKHLGRIHSNADVVLAVKKARDLGIQNISLDLMLGIPEMTRESLVTSINFCQSLDIQHISCYILKIEEGTPFHKNYKNLQLPDEDEVSELYLSMVSELEKRGFMQYEISNFAKPCFESRHNLKYWDCEEYIGLGPAAHSYYKGKRSYFPRDLKGFLAGIPDIFDEIGGDFEEFAMLKLRLSKGLSREDCLDYSENCFDEVLKRARKLPTNLVICKEDSIRLSAEGFLLSNAILANLLL